MDLFEKIGEIAKNVSEKAEDGLEINRLNGEISIEKGNIQCYKQELGEYFWAKFVLGEITDEEATTICDKVVRSQDHIKELEQQMEQVKINRELEKEEKKKQESELVEVAPITNPLVCGGCGEKIQEGQRFCSFCGKATENKNV